MNRITHETVIPSIRKHIAYLEREIEKVKRQITEQIENDPNLRNKRGLLNSIPGIGEATIAVILSALHIFERVDRVQQTVAFIGLAPKETTSGTSIKGKAKICKIGHARFRKALYMPALVSIQYNPVIIRFYREWKESQGYRMCYHAKAGSYYLRYPEIWQTI
ncbi:MAG: transposase [Syntrophales bacterium]